MVVSRIKLVPSSGIASSYKKKRKPKERWDISVFKDGANITPDMFSALQELQKQVNLKGGSFFIIDLYRSWEAQQEARKKFETGKKKAFVAKPGGSFHNAGRAVDISVKELNFPGIPKDEWLATLWQLAKPLGFRPIITIPDLNASEAWHFDFPGVDWAPAYDSVNYTEVAKCCILDVGKWNPDESRTKVKRMFVQAQLIRLGHYEIGKVDGVFGSKTNKVLDTLGVSQFPLDTIATQLALVPPQSRED